MSIRTALKATAWACVAVIAGGIGGFLSHAYLELWFEPVEGIELTNLKTWPHIPEGFRASFDLTQPQIYRAYYGENAGAGKTEISMALLVLRNFELSGKIVGSKTKQVDNKTFTYSINGYANSERLVLAQRGPAGGIGTFFLEKTQDADNNIFYFGYFLTEDYEPGSTHKQVTQCPFVMMDEALAKTKYPTTNEAYNRFDVLKNKCGKYDFPAWAVAAH